METLHKVLHIEGVNSTRGECYEGEVLRDQSEPPNSSLRWISSSIVDKELSLIFVTLRYANYNNIKCPGQIIITMITIIILTWEIILYQLVNEKKDGNK